MFVLFAVFMLWANVALALDLDLYGGIGQVSSEITQTGPGLWRHEGMNGQGGQPFHFDGKSMGFRSGLGLETAPTLLGTPWGIPVSRTWRFEIGAVSLGSPEMVKSIFNHDHSYVNGVCKHQCDELYALNLVNDYLGAEAVAIPNLHVWNWLNLYVKGGIAGFAHQHSGSIDRTWLTSSRRVWFFDKNSNTRENFSGMMLAAVLGGGVCGNVTQRIALCGDVEKFFPFAHSANPLIASGVNGPILTTFEARLKFWTF